ncbi:excalibur calcium-binding domain-containing protein [uncultured Arthrobacter sp.]|uniref:excalibur calcium-binding domain-containing protein n=1 Tax=uncultured Arthrobacter sp. TaxID=114050 RepID=UPI003217C2BE
MRLKKLMIASLAASAVVLSGTAVPASAAPSPKSYKNCTELIKVYPHGVGRKGARDKTSGQRVTTFRVDNTLYSYNDGGLPRHRGEYDLDRDNDGIACEKR